MRVFLNRHQHRAVLMEQDGTRIELRGMSQEDMQGLIDRAVERARDDQLDSNRAYGELPRLFSEDH